MYQTVFMHDGLRFLQSVTQSAVASSLMQTYAHAEWWQIFNTVMSYVVVLRASDHICMKNSFDCARQSSTFMDSPHMYAFIHVCHVMWCLLFILWLWKWVNLNCYRTGIHHAQFCTVLEALCTSAVVAVVKLITRSGLVAPWRLSSNPDSILIGRTPVQTRF